MTNMMTASKIRIAVVDDHPLMRRGLRETLAEFDAFEVVGEGATAEEAVELARSSLTDIMIIDVNMPGDGLVAVKAIGELPQPPKILVLTVYDKMSNVQAAMAGGASGYVLKGVDGDELAKILKSIHSGNKHVGPELAAKLFSESSAIVPGAAATPSRDDERFASLTKREYQIFELIGKGFSNFDIAKRLKLTEETVKHYNTPLFRKLNVKSRTEAALLWHDKIRH